METATPFDLNKAINDWREALASSPSLRSGDTDELEAHLRDSITTMEAKGLAPHEAFWVATNRLGTCKNIEAEFEKVNLQHVWLQRLLWMLSGSIVLGLVSSLSTSLGTLAATGVHILTNKPGVVGPSSVVLRLAIFALIVLCIWRSGQRRDGVVWRTGKWFKANPRMAGLAAFVVALLASAILASTTLFVRSFQVDSYASLVSWNALAVLPAAILAPPIALGWLLTRSGKKEVVE